MVPDFFIIGAPRCGTTALYQWLAQHPGIAMARAKECHFFANDVGGYRTVGSLDEYRGLFPRSAGSLITGEASVLYLFSEVAVKNILELNPRAKFIVAVRNPCDLVVSWHEQLLATSQEDQRLFKHAWQLCEARRRGVMVPRHCMDRVLLDYERIGQLGAQIGRLMTICDAKQVHFVRFEDLAFAPRQVYLGVLGWLGIEDDGYSDFRVINQNRVTGSPVLQRVWNRSKLVRAARMLIRSGIGERHYRRVRDRVMDMCTHRYQPRSVSPDSIDELEVFYEAERSRVKALCGFDV